MILKNLTWLMLITMPNEYKVQWTKLKNHVILRKLWIAMSGKEEDKGICFFVHNNEEIDYIQLVHTSSVT